MHTVRIILSLKITLKKYMKIKLAPFMKYSFPLIAIIATLFASASLFSYGIHPTHDGEYHVLRFAQFNKVLSEGNLYPRWAPDFNNGYGIPLFNYVYPLPNYVASVFHLLGFSFIDAFKLSMILATLTGAMFFYLWAKSYWGKAGGLVSSIFYTFSPYRLVDIYVRGSVGEVWSLGIFPALLWSYLRFHETGKSIFFIISCFSLALVIFSHNILAVMFFLFFMCYAFLLIASAKNLKKEFINLFLIIFIGFGIASPFWLPALLEINFVRGLQVFNPTDHFPDIYQLIIPSWGYGLSPSDLLNPMSVQIGIANIIAFLLSAVTLFFSKNKKILTFFIISFLVVFFLMTSWSIPIWKNIPLFSYFQFPWRFLSLEILISSFLAGAIVFHIKRRRVKTIAAIILIIMAVGLSINYARGATYYSRDDNYYLKRSNFTDGTNSPGNLFNTKWLLNVPQKTKSKFEFIRGLGKIKVISNNSSRYELKVVAKADSKILVNIAFFPGWTYLLDGKKYNVENFNGRMAIEVPKGSHKVNIFLSNTTFQNISYLYFLLSLLLMFLLSAKIDIIKK